MSGWIDGGITAVPGILAAGLHAGIKPAPARDLALVFSSTPATAAGVFTTNRIVGAPVKVTRERLKSGVAQAIVASSGCSNVATGEQGIRDAREMTEIVAKHLRIPDERVLVASTGVIGRYLPMDKIRPALPKLVKGLSPAGSRAAAEGIMTTDTHPKEAALRVEIPTVRCSVPMREQPGVPADPAVSRTVAKHGDRCFGVYADVAEAGTISVGDAVEHEAPAGSGAVSASLGRLADRVRRNTIRAGQRILP